MNICEGSHLGYIMFGNNEMMFGDGLDDKTLCIFKASSPKLLILGLKKLRNLRVVKMTFLKVFYLYSNVAHVVSL